MRISLVITVLNEASSILLLGQALANQSLLPTEVIIVDGGSTDETCAKLQIIQKKHPELLIKIIKKKGNRSVGRNCAIAQSTTKLIAITDAGCVPHREWLARLAQTYHQTHSPVIAGYYRGVAQTPFGEAVIPYALVMPDRVNPSRFLPATRSMMMEKKVWMQLGGFDERLSHNEDYAFARNILRANIPISFCEKAIVFWQPRENMTQFWRMIFRFAIGDGESKNWRLKVWLIYLRYACGIGLVLWLLSQQLTTQITGFAGLGCLLLGYLLWSIKKNLKYTPRGWYFLPLLQVISDVAVMAGTMVGVLLLAKRSISAVLKV